MVVGPLEVRFYSPTGERRAVNPQDLGPVSWGLERLGGMGEFSLPVHAPTTGYTNLLVRDHIELHHDTLGLLYRGSISERGRQVGAPDQLLLKGFGRMFDLGQVFGNALYVGGKAGIDIAVVAQRLFDHIVDVLWPGEWVSDIPGTTGITASRVDTRGKSLTAALGELVELSGGRWHWGVDVDPTTGKDRLYLRAEGDLASSYPVAVPGPAVLAASGQQDTSAIVNRLRFIGADLGEKGNKQTNGGFEEPTEPDGSAGGNLLRNGGFELGSSHDGWTNVWTGLPTAGGANPSASIKQTGGTPANRGDAFEGQYFVCLDNATEEAQQNVTSGIVAGRYYTFSAYARPAQGTSANGRIWLEWFDAFSTFLHQDEILVQATTAAWERWESTVQAPAGAVSALYRLVPDGGGNEMAFDDARLYSADTPAQAGWAVEALGTASHVTDWADETDSLQGAFHVKITVAGAQDLDTDDVRLYPLERIEVIPGVRYFWYVWAKTTSNPHKGILELRYYKEDGTTVTGPVRSYTFSGSGISTWSSGFIWATAPSDAKFARVQLRMRTDGVWRWDAFTFADDRALAELQAAPGGIPGDGTTPYLEGTALVLDLKAEDLVTALEDAAVNASFSTYGPREATESFEDATTIQRAKDLAKGYFLERGRLRQKPQVTLGLERVWLPGQSVRLVGEDGPALGGGEVLPIARVRGQQDASGLLTVALELGREQASIAALMRQAARQENARRAAQQR